MARQDQQSYDFVPTRCFMAAEIGIHEARDLAQEALNVARQNMPKFSGRGAGNLQPYFGEGFFGLQWTDPVLWYQEVGIRPFTMKSLAGKTIPMWIKDPTGKEQRDNPKAEVKVGEDGVPRVLIFRRAARHGARKTVIRNGRAVDVPQSFPGAPGRITMRETGSRPGKVAGQIASNRYGGHATTHVGVRWRHPGLTGRSFMYRGLLQAAVGAGIDPTTPMQVTNENWA